MFCEPFFFILSNHSICSYLFLFVVGIVAVATHITFTFAHIGYVKHWQVRHLQARHLQLTQEGKKEGSCNKMQARIAVKYTKMKSLAKEESEVVQRLRGMSEKYSVTPARILMIGPLEKLMHLLKQFAQRMAKQASEICYEFEAFAVEFYKDPEKLVEYLSENSRSAIDRDENSYVRELLQRLPISKESETLQSYLQHTYGLIHQSLISLIEKLFKSNKRKISVWIYYQDRLHRLRLNHDGKAILEQFGSTSFEKNFNFQPSSLETEYKCEDSAIKTTSVQDGGRNLEENRHPASITSEGSFNYCFQAISSNPTDLSNSGIAAEENNLRHKRSFQDSKAAPSPIKSYSPFSHLPPASKYQTENSDDFEKFSIPDDSIPTKISGTITFSPSTSPFRFPVPDEEHLTYSDFQNNIRNRDSSSKRRQTYHGSSEASNMKHSEKPTATLSSADQLLFRPSSVQHHHLFNEPSIARSLSSVRSKPTHPVQQPPFLPGNSTNSSHMRNIQPIPKVLIYPPLPVKAKSSLHPPSQPHSDKKSAWSSNQKSRRHSAVIDTKESAWLHDEKRKIKSIFGENKASFLRPSLTPHPKLQISAQGLGPTSPLNANTTTSGNEEPTDLKARVLQRVIAQFKVDCGHLQIT